MAGYVTIQPFLNDTFPTHSYKTDTLNTNLTSQIFLSNQLTLTYLIKVLCLLHEKLNEGATKYGKTITEDPRLLDIGR